VSIAVYTDVRWQTIHNWTVYPGIILAFVISIAATLAGRDMTQGTAWDVTWLGIPDTWSALAGFLSCGLIMLTCYVFFADGLGGGDVKLLAMVGAFVGVGRGLEVMLWTFVLGGCFALITLVWRVGFLRLVAGLARRLKWMLTARSWLPLTADEREPLSVRLYLSPATFVAVFVVRFDVLIQ